MNASEMLRLIDTIARERNIDKELLFQDLEQAMVSGARKHFGAEDVEEFACQIDRFTGQLQIWWGDEEISLEELGRIPAQTAKQVMIQRFREEERNAIFDEFSPRVGELVAGQAQRYEGGTLIVALPRQGGAPAEAIMPRREQVRGEQHQAGERVRCLIKEVREDGAAVKIIVSRAHEDFIRRLFEVEVPEVSERVIEVKSMAREAGGRTKVAVASIDSKVDAVGACVGVRGSRIRNIVDELGGEKIDIVRWNESSQILIQNALKPAECAEISLCFELGRATVVVAGDQLSLAIGKRGQNVRLAARLTGWDIDILTPEEFTKSLDNLESTLLAVEGVEENIVDQLAALGMVSVQDIEEMGADYLVETLLIEQALADAIVGAAAERAAALAEEQKAAKEAATAEVVAASEAEAQGIDDLLGGEAAEAAAPEATEAPAEEAGEEAAAES